MGVTLTIVGNLGRDPEMRYTPAGTAVTNINVATNRKYKNTNDEQIKETIWWRVSFWGKRAEAVNEWFKKGMPIEINARMNPDENGAPKVYEKKDGTWGASYEVTGESFEFISTGNGDYSVPAEGATQEPVGDDPKDIPF